MEQPKILIVDDDPELRRGLNLRLRANHYDTAYATDGVSAMAMAQKEKPDLIILDIGLPAGDGYVVLDRLQENASLSCIPVIVLTARDPQYNKDRICEREQPPSSKSPPTTSNCWVQFAPC
ncbi:MAG TPA: response regulator [Terriglobales bacterium]|jgi:DNA-binding response OmpR family regulator|nr:response regulator [Terriglobales bacterium]